MLHRYMKLSFLVFTMALLFAACADSVQERDVIGKTYVYEKEGFGGDFKIAIHDDGTFFYCEGEFSSYLGIGKWTLEEDTLILSDDEQIGYPLVNYFKVDGNDLVFLTENSSNFVYVTVADGERFTASLKEASDES